MSKKKFSVWIAREYIVLAINSDQAILKVQQHLKLSGEEMREFKIETAEVDMDKGERINAGVDIK